MSEANQTSAAAFTYPAEASKAMIEAGVFYGRKKSKSNPKMKHFVLANRAGIEIINLAKTAEELEAAMGFLREKVRHGGLVLLVGTQPAASDRIQRLAEQFGLPYVHQGWSGGTLTNFKIISKRVEYLKKLRTDLASGALAKYTKKERVDFEKEMERLVELFGGLENLSKVPDVVVMVDPNLHLTALRETNTLKIPVVALGNVDSDPDLISHLVPGNDKSRKSIEWFLANVETAIEAGVAERSADVAAQAAAAVVTAETGEAKK